MSKKSEPVIIIGMHRSGTSMLSDLLKDLGLYTGNSLGSHGEADFFLKLNDWLLSQTCASWDNPNTLEHIYKEDNKAEYNSFVGFLKTVISSPMFLKFKGIKQSKHWGFKDPVSSITLPFWLSVYPNAKVIYIKRHGLDVCNSLKVRNDKKFIKSMDRFKNKAAYGYYLIYKQFYGKDKRNRGFISSLLCKDFDYGLDLWDYYNAQCKKHLENVPDNRKIEIQYEVLLEQPEIELERAVSFIGLDANKEKISKVSKDVNSSRAYAYINKNADLITAKHKEVLKNHNY